MAKYTRLPQNNTFEEPALGYKGISRSWNGGNACNLYTASNYVLRR